MWYCKDCLDRANIKGYTFAYSSGKCQKCCRINVSCYESMVMKEHIEFCKEEPMDNEPFKDWKESVNLKKENEALKKELEKAIEGYESCWAKYNEANRDKEKYIKNFGLLGEQHSELQETVVKLKKQLLYSENLAKLHSEKNEELKDKIGNSYRNNRNLSLQLNDFSRKNFTLENEVKNLKSYKEAIEQSSMQKNAKICDLMERYKALVSQFEQVTDKYNKLYTRAEDLNKILDNKNHEIKQLEVASNNLSVAFQNAHTRVAELDTILKDKNKEVEKLKQSNEAKQQIIEYRGKAIEQLQVEWGRGKIKKEGVKGVNIEVYKHAIEFSDKLLEVSIEVTDKL